MDSCLLKLIGQRVLIILSYLCPVLPYSRSITSKLSHMGTLNSLEIMVIAMVLFALNQQYKTLTTDSKLVLDRDLRLVKYALEDRICTKDSLKSSPKS